MTLRGVLDVVLTDPGMARVVGSAGRASLAVTAPPPVQPLVAAALAAPRPGAGLAWEPGPRRTRRRVCGRQIFRSGPA